jgi:cysteine desulfurase
VGALYVRKGVRLEPLTFGGHQEGGFRNGTENVPAIVGLGKACEIGLRDMAALMDRLTLLRDDLEKKIIERFSGCRVNGNLESRLPHIASISFPSISGEALVRELDEMGIAASAGSACTAGSQNISPVLAAMKIPAEIALGTVRFSLGKFNTDEEIKRTAVVVWEAVNKLKSLASRHT